jgi:hypothetical protein
MHIRTPRTEEHFKPTFGQKRASGETPEFCRTLETESIMLYSALHDLIKEIEKNGNVEDELDQAKAALELVDELRK